ncbi:MAG: 30S ribosomal protein S17 [Candidatus Gastranaerophilales bacterium]|nr:30S ribosomal protein S17 [Candidatus Gastranaerophilales bacterium]
MPRKEKTGLVVSNKMDKTVVVKVSEFSPHPKYKKIIETTKNYKAHDENNACGEGDTVLIVETKPISKDKTWYVAQVVQKAT